MQKAKVFLREKQKYITIPINPEFTAQNDDLMLKKWQTMINLVAEVLAVKAGLIMCVTEDNMEVFLRSENEDNPYPSDGKDQLGHGLYCETVLGENRALYVNNALHADSWKDNPDVKLQMISYYGLPIKNPDGSFFGTICALDDQTIADSQKYRDLLDQFRQSIEADLQLKLQVKQMSDLLQYLALIAEISGQLIQVNDTKNFNRVIESSLAAFSNYFAFTRGYLFLVAENGFTSATSCDRHKTEIMGNGLIIEHPSLESLPWLKKKMSERQPLQVSAVEDLPVEAEAEKQYFQAQDLQSIIYLPLSDDHHQLKGFLRFEAVCSPVTLAEEQVGMLEVLAEIIFNTLLRVEAEVEILKLNEELEQRVDERTIELQAVNKELVDFAYAVSHDFRAPLRALDAFSANLESTYAELFDEKGLHYLNRIRNAAIYMSSLVDGMLNLTRITRTELNKSQVDLSITAADALDLLQKAEPERKVEISLADHLCVYGDPQFMKILMRSLLGNAWKFTSKEEQARIEVGETVIDDEKVFYVRDNGVGFNMTYADKLFGTFQRLHGVDEFPGIGIGLATVQRIINRHGGRIWAESAVDKGATFYFTLPG